MVLIVKARFRQELYRLILVTIILSLLVISCRVTLVPSYNSDIAKQIELVAKKVDKFYLTMLESTLPGDEREYAKFVQGYIDIEVELNSLLNKNRIRPLNTESTRNCEIALEIWIKYKEKHKKRNNISNADIDLNRDYLRDLFIVIQIGEEAKNNIND